MSSVISADLERPPGLAREVEHVYATAAEPNPSFTVLERVHLARVRHEGRLALKESRRARYLARVERIRRARVLSC